MTDEERAARGLGLEALDVAIDTLEALWRSGEVVESTGNVEKDAAPNLLNMWQFGFTHDCGTVACLAGWLVHSKALEPYGLRGVEEYGFNLIPLIRPYKDERIVETGLDALAHLFLITNLSSDYIFGPDNPHSFKSGIGRMLKVRAKTYPDAPVRKLAK